MNLKSLTIAASLWAVGVHGFKRLIKANNQLIDLNAITTDSNNVQQSCACDLTKGSCDTNCCCDPDCDANVKKFWMENYPDYCAKNKIASTYNPKSKCIDNSVLAGYNKRIGMSVTIIAGPSGASNLTCVSLDIESDFSIKKPEIQTFQEINAQLSPNIAEILL